jgi:hypothetical protein
MPTFTPSATPTFTPVPPPPTPQFVSNPLPPQVDVFAQNCSLINEARKFDQFYTGQASISADLVGNGHTGQGLRLDFSNVQYNGSQYSGWEVWLGDSDDSGIDLSLYSSLVFYIRGATGDEEPNIYLMMPITDVWQRYWEDVEVTTSWEPVVIPLVHFASGQEPTQQVDLRNVQRIQILFEWYEQPTSGRIFFDDLCVQ